jgi:hypothetical protein
MTAPAPLPIVEAFSLSHAQILDGSQTFEQAAAALAGPELDIYGVNDASLEPTLNQYENQGDDQTLSRWNWLDYAVAKIQAGYISFPLIANMTGDPLTSTGTGAAIAYSVDLWSETAMNVSNKPMLLKMPSKDKNGQIRSLLIGLYNCSFSPMTFNGPTYKDGLKVNYEATALMSDHDEKGAPFTDRPNVKRVGRLISVQAA